MEAYKKDKSPYKGHVLPIDNPQMCYFDPRQPVYKEFSGGEERIGVRG